MYNVYARVGRELNARKPRITHQRVIAGLTRNPIFLATRRQDGIPGQARDDGLPALACYRRNDYNKT